MTSCEQVEVVKAGWIQKRGEHIKTWRPRYFILKSDGSFDGYKSDSQQAEKCNNFTVRGCQIMSINEPRPYTFIIRGLQYNTNIERMFSLDTERERQDWVEAIRNVANKLSEAEMRAEQNIGTDVEMGLIAEDELLNQKFSVQGTSNTKASGKRKVVSSTVTFLSFIHKLLLSQHVTFCTIIIAQRGTVYSIDIDNYCTHHFYDS